MEQKTGRGGGLPAPEARASPEAYVTKDGSAIRELVHPAFTPGLGVSLAEAVVEAGGRTIPHFHTVFDEIYYCLEGEGVLYVEDEPRAFVPGGYHLMPRGAAHYLAAATRLRLLCVCSPAYSHEGTVLLDGPA